MLRCPIGRRPIHLELNPTAKAQNCVPHLRVLRQPPRHLQLHAYAEQTLADLAEEALGLLQESAGDGKNFPSAFSGKPQGPRGCHSRLLRRKLPAEAWRWSFNSRLRGNAVLTPSVEPYTAIVRSFFRSTPAAAEWNAQHTPILGLANELRAQARATMCETPISLI